MTLYRGVVLASLTCSLLLSSCSNDDNPLGINSAAKAFADKHWTYYDPAMGELGSYLAYEYWAAKNFGPDGGLSGTINYDGTIQEWRDLSWGAKSYFLPQEFFTKALAEDDKRDQYFYEIIGQYDQFLSGWPSDGDDPLNFRTQIYYEYEWTAANSYRTSYLNMLGGE